MSLFDLLFNNESVHDSANAMANAIDRTLQNIGIGRVATPEQRYAGERLVPVNIPCYGGHTGTLISRASLTDYKQGTSSWFCVPYANLKFEIGV